MIINTALVAISLMSALLVGTPTQAATEILDQVVAIVDDDVIMSSELRERVVAVTENLSARGIALPPEDELIREPSTA